MSLLPQHVAKLEASAIDEAVARERDYRSVTEKVVLERYSFSRPQRRVPALLIPVYGVTGDIVLHQARPDEPRMNGKGKPVKYETPGGSRMALDVHPRSRDRIGDPSVPLWITEGVLKGDALVSRGECALALLGVWSWRGTNSNGGTTVLPDFESVAFNGREVYLAFDSDVSVKPEVHKALERLKALLERRDARVRVVYLDEVDGEKVGIDDYLAAGGSLDELRDAAEFTLRQPQPEAGPADAVEEPEKPEERHEGPLPPLAGLLDDLGGFIRRYVVMTAEQICFLALWAFHTHAIDAADATPYPDVNSPEPQSGKTLTLEALELIVARPVMIAAGTTAAALARSAAKAPTQTILLDESDNTFKRDREFVATLTQIINAGYRRSGRALLCLPPDWEPSYLSVFGPKAIGGIGKLPDTVASRAVPIELKRKRRDEKVERFRRRAAEALAKPLLLAAAALAAEHVDELRGAEPELPDELSDRQQDCWEPLLAIADLAGGDWPGRAREAAVVLAGARVIDDASSGVQLLANIRDLFPDDRISCAGLVDALNVSDQLPYGGWNEGRGITTRELGKKLQPYGVKAKKIRLGEKTVNGYEHDQFKDAWSRYLPPDTVSNGTTGTTQSQSQKQAEKEPEQNADVPVTKNGANPHGYGDVPVVPVSKPLIGDPGFPLHGDIAFRNGHLTEAELVELQALDRFVRRDRATETPAWTDAEVADQLALQEEIGA
jgi:hypothetical protein